MAGGGKIQQTDPNQDIVARTPAYMKNMVPGTFPAGMPGQLPALAQQLGAGFGQTPQSFASYLNQVYQPAQTMNYKAPGPKPKTKVDPGPAPKPKPKPGDRLPGGRNAR